MMLNAQSTIALYTELHAECYQQSTIVDNCRPHVPGVSGANNTGPIAVAVYITLADGRCIVAEYSKS